MESNWTPEWIVFVRKKKTTLNLELPGSDGQTKACVNEEFGFWSAEPNRAA